MKKKLPDRRKFSTYFGKGFFCMRINLFLTLLLLCLVTVPSLAQSKKISLDVKSEMLSKILITIKNNSGERIIFNEDQLADIRKEHVAIKELTVKEAIDEVLNETDFMCEVIDGVYVIKRNEQQKVVKLLNIFGQVLDVKKNPLPGVTVVLKGSIIGTSTNSDGKFILTLPKQDTPIHLVFSYIGMKSKEIVYQGEKEISVILEEDSQAIEEVVVTGYQAIKEKAMAGSYSKVKAEDLVYTGTENLEQMLQGKLPGMMVINTSGLTGTRQKVRVRGTSTLVGNAEPVWVVDGIVQQDPLPFSTSELADISDDNIDMIKNFIGGAISWLNPRDIDDITVLKDASATAIYGVKAANGVIIITTKKGELGRLALNYSGSFSIGECLNYDKLELMNSQERVALSREAYEKGAQVRNEKIGYMGLALAFQRGEISYDEFNKKAKMLETINTDWFDILYQTPFSHSHSVSLSGGDQRTTYYASLGYSENENTAKGNEQNGYTARLNIASILWDKLRLNVALSASHRETKAFASGVTPFEYAMNTNRAIGCYNEDGSLFYYEKGGFNYNILNELEHSGNENRSKSINFSLDARWTIKDGLFLSSTFGGSSASTFGETWFTEKTHHIATIRKYNYGEYGVFDEEFKASFLPFGGMLTVNENENFNYTWRGQLEYIKNLGLHSINVTGGAEMNSNESRSYSHTDYGYMPERGNSFVDVPLGVRPDMSANYTLNTQYARTIPSVSKKLNNYISYYFTGSYIYDNRYAFNFSIRGDASNRFGQDVKQKYHPIWSVGGRWNVTDEHWLQNQDILNNLSITATFGYQGNVVESVSPDLIAKVLPLDAETGEFKMTYSKLPNPDLKWEKTKSINLGINFSLLKSKINGSFEYFYKKTTDLITEREIPYENGVQSMYVNGGDMKNSGWELTFSLVPIRTKDFVWNLSFNISKVYNELNSNLEPTGDWREVTNGSFYKQGYPVSSFWAFRFTGLDGNTGGPLFDLSGADSNYAALDVTQFMKHVGKLDPDLTAGINMNFRYKNWALGTSFYLSTGNQCFLSSPYSAMENTYGMPSEYSNASTQLLKRWQKPGDEKITNIPSIPVGKNCLPMYPFADSDVRLYPYEAWAYSDARVVDAWYLRCNSINLSYTLPEKLISGFAQNVNLSLTVSNPFQIVSSDFDGRDPEVARGQQPLTRSCSFSLNVSF